MAHIQFSIAGPFPIPHQKHSDGGSSKYILPEHAKLFWEDKSVKPFAAKQGCYVFAFRSGNGHTPWYVGKTSKSLSEETFTPDKLNKFNKVTYDGKKGTPVMFFVTRTDKKKKVPAPVLRDLKKFLIQTAKFKNPELINKVHTKNLDAWSVDGVWHPKKGTASKISNVFKKMMGL